MRNISRSSRSRINIDLDKSRDSYIHDKTSGKEYLDFFGMYASLPLGYNHKVFKTKEFTEEILRASSIKITNCEVISDEATEFDKAFQEYCSTNSKYKMFHYCCTGALALEAAIKCAIKYKGHNKNPKILSFEGSFHGINSWGCFITSREGSSDSRLSPYPEAFSVKVQSPNLQDQIEGVISKIESIANDLTAIVVEPIQCTIGDRYYKKEFFASLREVCDKFDIPLIFDEVQIGFGSTGKIWYHDHLDIDPDIVMFGKKTQLSGIMATEKMSKIFQNAIELEVTWDATLLDMIRCKHIISAYKECEILNNVISRSSQVANGLGQIQGIEGLRNSGLIMAFDINEEEKFKNFVKKTKKYGMIFNSSGNKTVRLRPNLNLSEQEANKALNIIELSLKS